VNRKRFDLVIFDCDGVLVDSELITNRIFVRMLNELGLALSLDDMFEQFVGRSMPQCLAVVKELLGRPLPDNFEAEFQRRSTAALKSELKAVAGIETVLAALTVPFCVASSGTHEKMQTTLGVTGLLPQFAGKMYSVPRSPEANPTPTSFCTRQAGKVSHPPPALWLKIRPLACARGWRPE
jgi:beta-phosphoglucomutase-like phosphatase (HAD superfamily)